MGIVIGIIVVLALAGLFAFLTCKSKNSDLFKWIGIAVFIAFCFNMIIPGGFFSEGSYVEYGVKYLGLTDVSSVMYYAVQFGLSTIIYLLVLGGFYGVISKTKGYQALVKKIANSFKKTSIRTIISVIVISVLLIVLTSISKTPFAMLVFVPFLVSILLSMKLDKVTAFAITFGSILVGVLGATYGTDGLYFLNYYMGTDITVGIGYRYIIAGIALVCFVVFNSLKVAKAIKKNRVNDLDDDPYAVEDVKEKVTVWPTIVVLSIIAIIVILGFVGWNNFNITIFDSFHKWLTELTIGKDVTIFSYILGSGAAAFGNFEINTIIPVLLVASVLVAFMSGKKSQEFFENFGFGFAKMFKPACLYALVYVVFFIVAMDNGQLQASFVPTMTDWAYGLTKTFNPFIASIMAFISSVFHADLGYSGFLVGSFVTTGYKDMLPLIHTLYVSFYGIVQLFMPVGGLLLIGLAYLKIDYKSWFKYIWMFVVTMVIVILILATIVAYI